MKKIANMTLEEREATYDLITAAVLKAHMDGLLMFGSPSPDKYRFAHPDSACAVWWLLTAYGAKPATKPEGNVTSWYLHTLHPVRTSSWYEAQRESVPEVVRFVEEDTPFTIPELGELSNAFEVHRIEPLSERLEYGITQFQSKLMDILNLEKI